MLPKKEQHVSPVGEHAVFATWPHCLKAETLWLLAARRFGGWLLAALFDLLVLFVVFLTVVAFTHVLFSFVEMTERPCGAGRENSEMRHPQRYFMRLPTYYEAEVYHKPKHSSARILGRVYEIFVFIIRFIPRGSRFLLAMRLAMWWA